MSDDPKVVRLVETKHGFKSKNRRELLEWLRAWAGTLEADDNVKSLTLVIETDDGNVFQISQSTVENDGFRLLGLLHIVSHRICDGSGRYPGL